MIKWRRDDAGQTAMEYLGMVLVVVALIGGLVVTGIGAQLTGGLQDAISPAHRERLPRARQQCGGRARQGLRRVDHVRRQGRRWCGRGRYAHRWYGHGRIGGHGRH